MVYLDRKVSAKEERLWHAFTKLDKSGNMKLEMSDIRSVLKDAKDVTFSEEELEEAFREADDDGNGFIDYDEFLYLWGSKNAPPREGSRVAKKAHHRRASVDKPSAHRRTSSDPILMQSRYKTSKKAQNDNRLERIPPRIVQKIEEKC